MPVFYAHSGESGPESCTDWQPLNEHLREVARLARERATAAFPNLPFLHQSAYLAGLLHDLGKYREGFQRYIRQQSVHPISLTYHKQAGAAKASDLKEMLAAFAIQGHHGGMGDFESLRNTILKDGGKDVASAVWPDAVRDCPELGKLVAGSQHFKDEVTTELFTRFIFSCLVDADWSNTSAYDDSVKSRPVAASSALLKSDEYLEKVLSFIEERSKSCAEPEMARIRSDILNASLQAAVRKPGLFSLTVPTGGGKTLSSLAFALKHASANGLRRLIYVAPYLSILDQNIRVIRQALGVGEDDMTVFAHHSLSDPSFGMGENQTARETAARRAENWDSPVVLTTNVQFFESLFANTPSRCRKLHNIANSVIILDECQTLPPDLVAPTCAMLNHLARDLGCTIVLCTATQPAFDHAQMPYPLKDVYEIIPSELDLFRRLRRVEMVWPKPDNVIDWTMLVARMHKSKSALAIVNSRRAAREIFSLLKPSGNAFHLSTSMCPAHRLAVLDEVRKRLSQQDGKPCYLVATQLVEAGVDIDFPLVFREMAPLEAIIQAAGRCNREGRLKGKNGSAGGIVEVFRSEACKTNQKRYYPMDGWYKSGKQVVETSFLNTGREPQVDSPEHIQEYFRRLYCTGNLDQYQIQALRKKFNFPEVADKYKLIDDSGEAIVIRKWADHASKIAGLLQAVSQNPSRTNYRKLAPYQVNFRLNQFKQFSNFILEEIPGVKVWQGEYDPDIGLVFPEVDPLLLI